MIKTDCRNLAFLKYEIIIISILSARRDNHSSCTPIMNHSATVGQSILIPNELSQNSFSHEDALFEITTSLTMSHILSAAIIKSQKKNRTSVFDTRISLIHSQEVPFLPHSLLSFCRKLWLFWYHTLINYRAKTREKLWRGRDDDRGYRLTKDESHSLREPFLPVS